MSIESLRKNMKGKNGNKKRQSQENTENFLRLSLYYFYKVRITVNPKVFLKSLS